MSEELQQVSHAVDEYVSDQCNVRGMLERALADAPGFDADGRMLLSLLASVVNEHIRSIAWEHYGFLENYYEDFWGRPELLTPGQPLVRNLISNILQACPNPSDRARRMSKDLGPLKKEV